MIRYFYWIFLFSFSNSFCQDGWDATLILKNSGKRIELTGTADNLLKAGKIFKDTLEYIEFDKVIIQLRIKGTDIYIDDTLSKNKVASFVKRHFLVVNTCESFNLNPPVWLSPHHSADPVLADVDRKNVMEGKSSFKISGSDEDGDGYLFSIVRMFKDIYFQSYEEPINSGASKTWFFFYLYSEQPADATFYLLTRQVNQLLANNRDIATFYIRHLPLDFSGWKPVSMRYSELQKTVPKTVLTEEKLGTEGNEPPNPQQMISAQYSIASGRRGENISINLDLMLLVFDK